MTIFTPPTEFPHECQTAYGNKVTLLAVDSGNMYACLWHREDGATVAAMHRPESLRNIPEVTSTWHNVYPDGSTGVSQASRESADGRWLKNRIGVLRIDITDGVTTCTLEDV